LVLSLLGTLCLGCGFREGEEGSIVHQQTALQAAASDLMHLGFSSRALKLREAAHRMKPTLEEAVKIASLYDRLHGGEAAGACLERLLRGSAIEMAREHLLDFYLESWQWTRAARLIAVDEENALSRGLQDLLSRTKKITDAFGRTHALTWHRKGCRVTDADGSLHIVSGSPAPFEDGNVALYTPVGWNGGGFHLAMDLRLMALKEDAALCWGLSMGNEPGWLPTRESGPAMLILYRQGSLSFRCSGSHDPASGDEDLKWYWPANRWVRLHLEFLPDARFLAPFATEEMGRVRAWIVENQSGRRLLQFEAAVPTRFEAGRMMAGLFRHSDGQGAGGVCSMYVDNFLFQN
jgi:hypothetical protein